MIDEVSSYFLEFFNAALKLFIGRLSCVGILIRKGFHELLSPFGAAGNFYLFWGGATQN